jgi:hypothetical protein
MTTLFIECHNAQCYNAECHDLLIVRCRVKLCQVSFMLNVVYAKCHYAERRHPE